MVRTKADSSGRKAVAAKAPRKVLGSSGGGGAGPSAVGSPAGKVSKYAGGNAVCPRPTPEWQKGIGSFLTKTPNKSKDKENADPAPEEDAEAGGSSKAADSAMDEGCGSSKSQEQSSGGASQEESMESEEEEEAPEKSSPVKKNGLISDSDED